MGILNVFDGNEAKTRKSHLKNLLELALIDGSFDETEMSLLKEIAGKLDMTEEDIAEIRNNPEEVKFTPPTKDERKIEQMSDLVKMMMIDHEIQAKEVKLCKNLALKLNLAPNIVDDLIDFEINNKDKKDAIFNYRK